MAEQSLEGILNAFIEDAEAVSTQMTVEDKQRVLRQAQMCLLRNLKQSTRLNTTDTAQRAKIHTYPIQLLRRAPT